MNEAYREGKGEGPLLEAIERVVGVPEHSAETA